MDDDESELANLFRDRVFVLSVVEAAVQAIASGTTRRYQVSLAVRARMYSDGLDWRGLPVSSVTLELFRRLEEAGIVRSIEPKNESDRISKDEDIRLALVIPLGVARSIFKGPILDRITKEHGDPIDGLRTYFNQKEYGSDEEWSAGAESVFSIRETESVRLADLHLTEVDEANANYATVEIFYATNRSVSWDEGFGAGRDATLHFGQCSVSVPHSHKIGELERPLQVLRWEFTEDPNKHVVLRSQKTLSDSELFGAIARGGEGSAFVFVHGYCVTFADAVLRTAQLKHDLRFSGAAILFSWPSRGTRIGYLADEGSVEWSIPYLDMFLTDLASRTGLRTIHIIAHSMGNRVVARSLAEMSVRKSSLRFQNVVLAAPDIDRGVFMQLAPALASSSDAVTLYASSRDNALALSKTVHAYSRAGDTEDIVVAPPITTIDVSVLDTDIFGQGHSYITSDRNILSDLYYVLAGLRPPRFGLSAVTTTAGTYWRVSR